MAEVIQTKIRGVSHHQKACGLVVDGQPLVLKRDPDNVYDSNAISVRTRHGELLGHVSAKLAADLAIFMDNGGDVTAVVTETTGGTRDKPTLGVNIKLVAHRNPNKPGIFADSDHNPPKQRIFADSGPFDSDHEETSPWRLLKTAMWTTLIGGLFLAMLFSCT
ncbi:MAG: HIRAN domain-containing protein [Gammaproteobacteria bacterium]|nr:HIRAN domain-containing protein [Gammaproteobacteria bacterium]